MAGSGKSIIAQYRLAYLYKIAEGKLHANDCLILGPSRLFLNYAARVLPRLNVHDISQGTFADWACERIGLKNYRVEDAVLIKLLASEAPLETANFCQASVLKNSRRMCDLLHRYLVYRQNSINFPANGLSYVIKQAGNLALSLSAIELREAFETAKRPNMNEHRERFIELVHRKLLEKINPTATKVFESIRASGTALLEKFQQHRELETLLLSRADEVRHYNDADLEDNQTAVSLEQGAQGLVELGKYYKRQGDLRLAEADRVQAEVYGLAQNPSLIEGTLLAVQAAVQNFWPDFDVVKEYRALLSNRSMSGKLSSDLFSETEIDLLSLIPQPTGLVLDISDIAGLLYLYRVYYGLKPKYKHIIIDEAQDTSWLQLEEIRCASQNGSVTVLGDLAQSIFSYRGVASWEEVKQVFEGIKTEYKEIRQNYRNTYEIMSFANNILRTIPPTSTHPALAIPFDRHDAPPILELLKTSNDLYAKIIEHLKRLRSEKHHNIAVIVKTIEQCQRLDESLRNMGYAEISVAHSGDFEYEGGVLLIPAYLAKGLEFEAVIIVNASADHYTDSEFDVRLLYVAATRALHELHILGVGTWAPPIQFAMQAETG